MSLLSRLFGTADAGYIPYAHRSPEGLCARWVQWGAATNIAWNPIADETGARASAKQPDDVWFLAGCFGGSVKRTCTVPANKELFFPAFNIWASSKHQLPDPSKVSGYLPNQWGRHKARANLHTTNLCCKRGVGQSCYRVNFKPKYVCWWALEVSSSLSAR